MIETTLVIDQNTSLRGMRVDGEERFSVLDFITYVCPGRNPNYASVTWFAMTSPSSKTNVAVPEYFYYKFHKQNNINTPCMAIAGLQKLLFILGARVTSECGNRALECFYQVLAGDRTRIRETEPLGLVQGAAQGPEQGAEQGPEQGAEQGPEQGAEQGPAQGAEQGPAQGPAQQIALPGAWDPQDPNAYTVHEGALVSDILTGMLGPLCDENRDAYHKLQLKIQELHAQDPARAAMKAEVWMFKGDGTMWVNTTSVIKYIYTGSADNFSRTQQRLFKDAMMPHKLLQVPKVKTTFFRFVPENL